MVGTASVPRAFNAPDAPTPMSFCTAEILKLSEQIYDSVGSPTNLSIGYISGWLTSPGTLAALNNRLTTSFALTGTGPCIAGGFTDTEGTICGMMFEVDHYKGLARSALAGSAGAGAWTNIREGDSSVSRASPAEIARAYNQMKKDAEEDLGVAVANWKLGHTQPVGVSYAPMPSWPTP